MTRLTWAAVSLVQETHSPIRTGSLVDRLTRAGLTEVRLCWQGRHSGGGWGRVSGGRMEVGGGGQVPGGKEWRGPGAGKVGCERRQMLEAGAGKECVVGGGRCREILRISCNN